MSFELPGPTVSSLLRRTYDVHAGHIALVHADGTETSFGRLRDLAAGLAGALTGLGLARGDRVVIAARNCAEYVVVDHALFWGGFVRVAVSFRLHAKEIAEIAEDCSAGVVVADADRASELDQALRAAGVPATVVSTSPTADFPSVADLAVHEPVDPAPADREDLVWMPYTSGTTGRPKGVMHTHRSILATIRNMMVELPPITERDTMLQVAPLSHLAGWYGLVYTVRGARQLFSAEFDAREAVEAIGKHRVTAIPIVPTILAMMTDELDRGDYDVSSMRTIIYGGSAIAPGKLARAVAAFGDVFVQSYGLTELPMPVSSLSQEDHKFDPAAPAPERLGSAGRITPYVEVRIVDADGHDVPEGESGEIWIRGDMMMTGYWHQPEETAAFLRPDSWASTGDIGRLTDGYLYIVDRKRDLIVSGGFNVFPSEVEKVIGALPGVAETAVVGVPDPQWGESVLAVVVREPGGGLTEEQVLAACRDSIAGYKKPRRVEFADELPKNSSGKLLRRELRAKYWEGHARLVDG
ncbi:class I adenylate-forming enzyme family protein [Amycolatopsis sp. Poz14]|uniref:class I adenylate-forming enzyme family protein n=1 Tax=Amycolatopsis sp. Poz14 TaxID=1447705 RepID=UPI001EE93601|nr:AMP-binding protein [Amycolatopsis sp. Poz14]MCG3754084.1 AMP-binding protein [Amycolatopsis sp. Poz14]